MKKILLIIFSIIIIIEIVVLHQDNKNLIISNNTTLEELKQNNLIEDGKVSLDSVYKEEEEAREKEKLAKQNNMELKQKTLNS